MKQNQTKLQKQVNEFSEWLWEHYYHYIENGMITRAQVYKTVAEKYDKYFYPFDET